MTPGQLVAWAADRYGTREAVVDGARRFSFREVHRRTNRLANALVGLGCGVGDRAALLLPNRAEVVETLLGASKAGCARVALNTRQAIPEHAFILNDSGAAVLVVDQAFRELVPPLREQCPSLRHVIGVGWGERDVLDYDLLLDQASDRNPAVEVRPDDLERVFYTSGTSGRPKGVINTFRTFQACLRTFFLNVEYRLGSQDSMVHAGPLTHAPGNYVYPYLARGARNIILPRFEPGLLLATVERERATTLLLVPTMLTFLLESDERSRYDLRSLHTINYGAAPTPEALICRGIEAFGPIFRQHYGLGEAHQPITVLRPDEHALDGPARRRLASCGKPALGVELRVVGDEGEEAKVGEVGEVCLRGDNVMPGYWRNPAATAEAIRDGWLHTGDVARQDEEGYLYIVDRKKDMIISGGFNVYPREVEEVLYQHPAVQDAAVFGIPDERWGEAVMAAVVLRSGCQATANDLRAFCAGKIAGYKRPRAIEFLASLPTNAAGKVLKRTLREPYWQGHERQVV
jgi:acyl-CoA synthetase (AMP-forming)/AMP-acid ligase II